MFAITVVSELLKVVSAAISSVVSLAMIDVSKVRTVNATAEHARLTSNTVVRSRYAALWFGYWFEVCCVVRRIHVLDPYIVRSIDQVSGIATRNITIKSVKNRI